ncbi:MAG TPA: substrate-binding domain-containing protein [Jatrophihabitans sp.]
MIDPIRSKWARFAALVATVVIAGSATTQTATAASYVPLQGDGSSWAQPAIDQWSRDVNPRGITVNFSGDGSAAGRQHYIVNQADFAASDIAFLTSPDPFGAGTEQSSYAYSYVPIVAGGTSFLYNLVVGGKRITNLRLSGETLAKIFTGKITDWSDPAIAHDYGQPLPSQKITVITRSDGSGASYMFSRWMWKEYPSLWKPFCQAQGGGAGCGPSEFYPGFSGSVQRNGSDQVASYISSPSFGEGSIGYDEYAYALNNNIPVVKVLNKAGYYSLPTPSNVAIALQRAVIDQNPSSPTFLMQNLDGVYTNSDPRTYPLSSYSYLIIPRDHRLINGNNAGPPPRFDPSKGTTLSTWMNYVLCGAQQKAGALGYSPLPKNLVVGGFEQVAHVPGHVATPDLKQLNGCNNPTYSNGVNHLIVDAPQPNPCDKLGTPLTCGAAAAPAAATSSRPTSGSATSIAPQPGTTQATTQPNGAPTGHSAPAVAGPVSPSASTSTDPETGQQVTAGQSTSDGTLPAAVPVALQSPSGSRNWLLPGLTALDILAAVALPGVVLTWLRRRRPGDE